MIGSSSASGSACKRASSTSAAPSSLSRTRAAVACSHATVSAKAAPHCSVSTSPTSASSSERSEVSMWRPRMERAAAVDMDRRAQCTTMDLRQLEYFAAVARHRHFRRAAESLYVTQSAVSRAVRRLETELGLELLRRTSHGVEITPAGEELLGRAEAILSDVAGARAAMDEHAGTLRGGVRAAATTGDALRLAPAKRASGASIRASGSRCARAARARWWTWSPRAQSTSRSPRCLKPRAARGHRGARARRRAARAAGGTRRCPSRRDGRQALGRPRPPVRARRAGHRVAHGGAGGMRGRGLRPGSGSSRSASRRRCRASWSARDWASRWSSPPGCRWKARRSGWPRSPTRPRCTRSRCSRGGRRRRRSPACWPSTCADAGVALQHRRQLLLQPPPRPRADELQDRLAVTEEQEGRHRQDAVLGGDRLVGLDVEADDANRSRSAKDRVENRVHRRHGLHPGSPEVDQDRRASDSSTSAVNESSVAWAEGRRWSWLPVCVAEALSIDAPIGIVGE